MIEIKINDHVIEVDDEFEELRAYSWWIKPSGSTYYAMHSQRIGYYTRKIPMHRLIMAVLDFPEMEIDHKDGNGLNNQKSNLRIATRSQNSANKMKSSGGLQESSFKGVTKHPRTGRWRARLRNKNLGCFDNEIEAALAYDKAIRIEYGEFGRTNF